MKFKRNKRHKEEIRKKKSYARSHGLFLGLSLENSGLMYGLLVSIQERFLIKSGL